MAIIETTLRRVLASAARFLPEMTRRAEAALIADHRPIMGTGNVGGSGANFWLTVAVAPNHSPHALLPHEFVDRANELATAFFADKPFYVDYSGSSEVRLVAGTSPEHEQWGTTHTLRIFPSGLVTLQWVLQASPLPNSEPGVELSLDEIIDVFFQMYDLVHSPRFAATHRHKRLVQHRLDWRVGLSPSANGAKGATYWRRLISSAPLPTRVPTRQNPYCPTEGYAAMAMSNRKMAESAANTFRPALQDLFTTCGYSGKISDTVDEALARVTAERYVTTTTGEYKYACVYISSADHASIGRIDRFTDIARYTTMV